MGRLSSLSGPSDYLESLMQAGQQATKQFDDALAAAMGVESKPADDEQMSPFAIAANLQQRYWSPVLDFWRGFFNDQSAPASNLPARVPRGDRRFRDEILGVTRPITTSSSRPIC